MPTALFPDGTAYPFTATTPPRTLAALKQLVAAVSGYPAEDLVFPAGYTDENVYHPTVEAIWSQGETISVVRDVERGEQLRRLYELEAFDANEPWNGRVNTKVKGFLRACVLGTEDTDGYTNNDGGDDTNGERHDHHVPKDADFLRDRAMLAPEHREVVETMLQDFELIHTMAFRVWDEYQIAAVVRELPLVYRKDRTFVMDLLQMQPAVLEWADEALRDDADVVRSAVCRSLDNEYAIVVEPIPTVAFDLIGTPRVLQYASDRLRNDKPFLESIISFGTFQPNILAFASDHVRTDQAFAKHLIVTYGVNPLPFLGDALRDDDTLVHALLDAVATLPTFDMTLPTVDTTGLWNYEMHTTLVDARAGGWRAGVRLGTILDGLSQRLCQDREIAVRALKAFPADWTYLPRALKHDEALHRMVVKDVGTNRDFCEPGAADALPDDLVVQMVKQYENGGALFPFLNETQRDTPEIVLAAVRQIGTNLQYASERLRDNATIVRIAITPDFRRINDERDESALRYASERLRHDRDFVRSVLRISGMALLYVEAHWKEDADLVREAVTQNPAALDYAAPHCVFR